MKWKSTERFIGTSNSTPMFSWNSPCRSAASAPPPSSIHSINRVRTEDEHYYSDDTEGQSRGAISEEASYSEHPLDEQPNKPYQFSYGKIWFEPERFHSQPSYPPSRHIKRDKRFLKETAESAPDHRSIAEDQLGVLRRSIACSKAPDAIYIILKFQSDRTRVRQSNQRRKLTVSATTAQTQPHVWIRKELKWKVTHPRQSGKGPAGPARCPGLNPFLLLEPKISVQLGGKESLYKEETIGYSKLQRNNPVGLENGDKGMCYDQANSTGRIVKTINQTHLVLIPKTVGASDVDKFRPISLCNNILKLVTRIMVRRFRLVLSHIMGDNHNVFLHRRCIQDGISFDQEMAHALNIRKPKVSGIKPGLSKAYDRVSLEFLRNSLLYLGFGGMWIDKIMTVM
ncbi:hypothetical protein EJ110_NYTH43567 [Nymphaea thermarum]|nr:hypothetical protein EJ110_NYTH43567 [Nymphaea thermarum]